MKRHYIGSALNNIMKRTSYISAAILLFVSSLGLPLIISETAYAAIPPAASESEFTGSARYVREANISDIVTQVRVPSAATAVQFTVNGVPVTDLSYANTPTDNDIYTVSGAAAGSQWYRLQKSLPGGQYSLSGEFQVSGVWYPITGSSTTYSIDNPAAEYLIPQTNQAFRANDKVVRVKADDEFNQFNRMVTVINGTSYEVLRSACTDQGNFVLCDLQNLGLAQGSYTATTTTYTLANNRYDNLVSPIFSIDSTAPVVSNLVITNAAAMYSSPINVSVTATDNGVVDSVRFYITTPRVSDNVCDGNGAALLSQISTSATSTFNASLNTSGLNGVYCVNATAKDTAANNGNILKIKVIIDNTGPSAPVISFPTNGAVLKSSDVPSVDWNDVTDPSGPGVQYDYQVSTSSALSPDGSFLNPLATIRGNVSEQATLNTPEGTYYIHVRAIDVLGNVGAWSTVVSATVDNTPPATIVNNLTTTNRAPTITGVTDDKDSPVSVTLSGVMGLINLGNASFDPIANLNGTYNWSVVVSPQIDAGLYTITAISTDLAGNSSTSTGDLEVQKTDVTITADNQTKVYGEANPTFTYTVSALPYGEDETVLGTITCTPIAEDSNVGTYTITCTAPGNVNYNVVSVDGSLEITEAPVTVTADNQSRVYGDANPALTFAATGLKYSQDQSVLGVTCATTAVATSTVAGSPYAITCSGASNANYNVSYVAGSLTVTPAPVTVTAANKSKTYGANNPSLTFSSVGRKNGEVPGVLGVSCVTTAVKASPAGTYPITCSGSTNTNYAVIYNAGTLTINKASLFVIAPTFTTRTYGDANPAFNPTYAGFVNGDSASSLTTAPTCSTTADATSPVVGFYLVTCGSGVSGNYNFIYVPGLLVITQAPVTITADDATKVYGEANPSFTYSVSGLKNSQLPSVLGTIECTTSADVFSSVGDYDINCMRTSAQNFNYAYTFEKGTLSVTPAMLSVTASDQTRVYGEANPTLGLTYTGFVNGDDASSLIVEPTCSTTADLTSPVDTYPVTCTGGTADNYSFTYTAGILTVTKAQLIVTAQNQTRTQGTANPTLSYIVSGFVNGDTTSVLTSPVTCTTTADTNSTQGTYPINCSGAVSDNYSFVYTDAELSVTPAPVTVNRSVARLAAAPQGDDSLVLSETTTTPNGSTSGEVKSDDDSNSKTNRPAVAIDSNKFLGLGWWWLPLLLTLAGASYGYARYRVR